MILKYPFSLLCIHEVVGGIILLACKVVGVSGGTVVPGILSLLLKTYISEIIAWKMIQMPTNAIKVIFLASWKMEKNKIDVRILGLQKGTKKTLIQHSEDSNFSQF